MSLMSGRHGLRGAAEGRTAQVVIVDRYNTIEAGDCIGYDGRRPAADSTATDSGIVVIPRGQS